MGGWVVARRTDYSNIKPDVKNANRGTERGRYMVEASLRETGAGRSILLDKDGRIIAGNKTFEAASDIGLPVRVVETDGTELVAVKRTDLDLDDDTGTARKLAYYDNRAAQVGLDWDAEQMLADLGAGLDLSAMFRQDELDELLADMQPKTTGDTDPQVDRAEELREKWGTAPGQLWQLGEHRLLCGDCTDAATVARVMGGGRARAVVTDPPYGINREGIPNDDPEGLRALFDGCLAVMPVTDAVMIAFQSPRLEWVWLDAMRAAGWKSERLLWMYDENDQTKPWHYWLMCSQAIRIASMGRPEWAECKAHHDTYVIGLSREFRAGGDGNEFAHASVKPVGVVADLIAHTTGDVYEPFSGSGTTIIACENLGRRCRACEISPGYVGVALERYFQHTGVQPVLLESAA